MKLPNEIGTNLSQKRVLITGASGFIGRRVCYDILKSGYLVRGLSRRKLSKIRGFEPFCIEDICSVDWDQMLEGCNYVVHLAAMAHKTDPRSDISPKDYHRVNKEATGKLCKAIRDHSKITRLVFMSTIGAMTLTSDKIINENTPCRPVTPYGRSKLEAECELKMILSKSEVDWCILRPPLVYGPRNPGNMNRLTRLVKMGVPLPFGGVKGKRNFIFVGNLSDAILKVIKVSRQLRKTYCIADEEILSLPELIRMLSKIAKINPKLFSVPQPILHTMGYLGDALSYLVGRSIGFDSYSIDRLLGNLVVNSDCFRSEIGWRQRYSLENALHETIVS